ncbi:hypothetical protein ETB97_012158 [Aspergillus alliaceus]|uniref:Protein kinase domain-containing protein n=1 Tax=Petromyces alliaceus TaxID=209559 RepID=A0A8H6AA36_PETAA|nr:hypothetical protein ETB97_012158 [Aspergillus burnettii]
MDQIAERFRLDVTVISENCNREILQHNPGQAEKENRRVIVWTRKRDLTQDVYVEESQSGQVRVVKRVTTTDKRVKYRSELDLMGGVSQATDKLLFVDFIGWFPYKDYICLAMKYCPYGDLKGCYPNPTSEPEAREICAQLLEGLAVLHSLSIVHRDIKPEAVSEKTPIKVKIADFGVSKRAVEGQTEPRTGCGTPGFMAPEVLHLLDDTKEDSTFTSAVDIWSLGCLLYYILTKQVPFSIYESLLDYAKGRAAFPEGHLRDNQVGLTGRGFIKRLLEPLPDARPSASVDVSSSWVILDRNEEFIGPEFVSTTDTISAVGISHGLTSPTQLSVADTQWRGLLKNTFTRLSSYSTNEMVSPNPVLTITKQ